jgi:hypothetical protein
VWPRRGERISLVVVANNDNSGKTECLEFLIASCSLGFLTAVFSSPPSVLDPRHLRKRVTAGTCSDKTGKAAMAFPRFRSEFRKTRGKKLELEADTKLHLARSVALSPPSCRPSFPKISAEQRKVHADRFAKTLPETPVLPNARLRATRRNGIARERLADFR